MWKAILAGAGALTTALGTLSLSASTTGHEISSTAVAVAVLGALSTGAATYLKSNDPKPVAAEPERQEPDHDWPTADELAEPPSRRRDFWK
jgi:hypothetical protein